MTGSPVGEVLGGDGRGRGARLGEPARRGDVLRLHERHAELAGELLVGQQDELAAGDRVEHVDVGPADALLLPPERPLGVAHPGDVERGERPAVAPDRVGLEQLVGVVALDVELGPRGRAAVRRARHDVEVRARALVEAVGPAEPLADGLLARQPRALLLRRVDVDELEVGDRAVSVAHDREHREALHRVLEEACVAFLRDLQVPEVAQPQKEQERGRHGDEEDPLDRRQHELHVVRQPEQPKDAVGGDDPDDGHGRVDQRVAHRHLPRRAAPPLAGFRPICRHCSQHRIALYLGDSSAMGRTLHVGGTPADADGTAREHTLKPEGAERDLWAALQVCLQANGCRANLLDRCTATPSRHCRRHSTESTNSRRTCSARSWRPCASTGAS